MTRDIATATASAATASSIHPVYFLKLEFDSGNVNLHSELGDITWGGDTYTGTGKLSSIGQTDEVSDLSQTQITVGLSGIPGDYVSLFFNEKYQGRRATLFLGYLNSSHVLVDTPTIIFRGLIDTASDKQDKEFAITLTIGSRFSRWNTAVVRRYNNATQQARFPGDKGLQFIEQMANKTVIWGAAS